MSGTLDRVRFSRRWGFTLVELLVVVAIIALLVSILLPTLGKAKAAVKIVICSTNLKAIGGAAWLYATENDDYVPRDSDWYGPACHDPAYYFFAARLSPFVSGPTIPFEKENDDTYLYEAFKSIGVYRCPSFKSRNPDYVLTYISNGYNFEEPTKWGTPISQLAKLPRPAAEVVYLAELNHWLLPAGKPGDSEAFGRYDFLGRRSSTNGPLVGHDATFNENGMPNIVSRMIRYDDDRHYGRTTVAYFDGHAVSKWLTPEEMPTELFFPK